MNNEKVVIIIPTYNESAVIEETIRAVFDATQSIDEADIHILVFDSASSDGTSAKVQALQRVYPRLHLKTETQKSGLGSAYLQAMRYALHDLSADVVIEFDADLSHQPNYLPLMLEQLKTCDVVLGSRYVSGGSIPSNWGWHRKLLSVLGNYVARAVLTPKYKDFTTGFRATRRHVLKKVLPNKFLSNHYAYKLHLLWLLHQSKAKIVELPIAFVDREKGVSKLPANSVFDSLRVIFTLRLYTLKRYVSMCLVGVTGMSVQFLVYNLCRAYVPLFYASQLAVTAAIVNNFILNSRITFKHHQRVSRAQKAKALTVFLAYSVGMIYFQSYWLLLGVSLVGAGAAKENLIMISGMVVGSVLNYLTYSRIVWRDKV
jgi:dolichol-phosphate mannosyltransferase